MRICQRYCPATRCMAASTGPSTWRPRWRGASCAAVAAARRPRSRATWAVRATDGADGDWVRVERGQGADLVTIGCHRDGIGFWGGLHQVSVTPRDEVDPAIAMFSTESLKSSSSQALGFLGRGIGHEEMEVDLGGEFAE